MHIFTVVKRSLVRPVLGGVAFVLLTGVVTFDRQKLPLNYGVGPSQGQFEVEFTAVPYQPAQGAVPVAGLNTNITMPSPNPEYKYSSEPDLLRYLALVKKSDYRQAAQLHAPGDGAAALAAAQALGARVSDLEQVDFLRKVLYGPYRVIFVRLLLADGQSLVTQFHFVRTGEGFRTTSELDAGAIDLLALFESMAHRMAEDLSRPIAARQFDHALEFGAGLFGLRLHFNGELFANAGPWRDLAAAGQSDTPRAYVETVLSQSAALGDEEFAALWCGEDRRRFAGRTPLLANAKREHSVRRAVKHVATMDFDGRYAHFYLGRGDPGRVRVVFLATAGDGYCLGRGPGRRSLRGFLRSAVFSRSLLERWQEES